MPLDRRVHHRDRARDLRRNASLSERRLWSALRHLRHDGLHFRRQAPIGDLTVDFAWLSGRLVVEVDGDAHAEAERARADRARDRLLAEMGYRVVRVSAHEAYVEPEAVAETIRSIATTGVDPRRD